MKIAIVHEMLIKLGGAERVLLELMKMYPNADVFTLMYDEKKVSGVFLKSRVNCVGPAQWLFRLTGKPRVSLPLMPFSTSRINLSGYDLVISSSSGFAHGVKKGNNAIHICYCHSPARYLWDATDEVQEELGLKNTKDKIQKTKLRMFLKRFFIGPLVRILFSWLRRVDLRASKSPNIYIANSCEVQGRIQKYYQRNSVVLWPPVDTLRFTQMKNDGCMKNSERKYFVVTSALTPFKQVDRVIRVMTKIGIPLKIIGDGAQRAELQKIAGNTIEFLGKISDEAVVEIYKNARGFLMPQKEDAGIAPLEALAAGIPVFGLAKGGLLEVNIDGVTGRFFSEETDDSFLQGFLQFDHEIGEGKYDNADILRARASEFDAEKFRKGFQDIVRVHLGA